MSLHKIEIRGADIFRNHDLQGRLSTSPPEGIRASMSPSSKGGIALLHVQWKLKKPPQPAAPLELLRIEVRDFSFRSMFIAGRRYELAGTPYPQEREKGFPYGAYYKFKLRIQPPYDAALHAKMPLACWQKEGCAIAVVFPKFVRLSNRWWPVGISASGGDGLAALSLVLPDHFELQRKPFGWFGTASSTDTLRLNLANEHLIEASFAILAADNWPECVRAFDDQFGGTGQPQQPQTAVSADMLERSLGFYDRVWDARNRTHAHLPIKNAPGFESVEFKHSHITDDITKLALYRRLINIGWDELAPREQDLLQNIAGGRYSYKSDGGILWHTTTYFNGARLEAFTHHGTGFVGFPGGMATNVRRLYEYHALTGDSSIASLADSGAEWLQKTQREDGSWPPVHRRDEKESPPGCVASAAESARALLGAYHRTKRHDQLKSAEAAITFINRDESFFGCRQYLRDVSPNEADGISAEACIHANLDAHLIAGDKRFLDCAEKWGYYALQWIRPCFLDEGQAPSFDGLSHSITPRVDVWGGLLIARALMRLGRAGGEQRWLRHAWRLFHEIAQLQERDGGLCETWFFDFPDGLESIHIEPTFATDALVEFLLDAEEQRPLSVEIAGRKKALKKKFPPLRPIAPMQNLVGFAKAEPAFLINRTIRLKPAFSGMYGMKARARHFLYRMLRIKPFRRILKLIPAEKILLNRHRIHPPVTGIRGADRLPIKSVRSENFGANRQSCTYKTAYHTLTLSLLGAGNNEARLPANDISLDIETTAGDLAVDQARIDLLGDYRVQSVAKEDCVISAGGIRFRLRITEGSLDGIIRNGDTLSFDISLRANWNFYGKYHLRMRIEQAS